VGLCKSDALRLARPVSATRYAPMILRSGHPRLSVRVRDWPARWPAILVFAVCTGRWLAASPSEPPIPSGSSLRAVYSAEVDSIIHPVSAKYMIDVMARADAAGAELVVFSLRTPGGLVDSTRDIISHMLAAKTPVAVFVGPAGARAASAGFLLTIAADVAAMAPGTHFGAAHPVAGPGGGEKIDETMAKKVASDVAAYARTLATKRHRNVALAEQAVNESRAFTEQEAASATPPLIDLVTTDIPDLLEKLDGRQIARFDGSTVVLHTRDAQVVQVEMSWRERILSAVAHPNVAYVLFSLGTLGLAVELWSPGAILPGIAGGICLLLAFFAFQVLPVNYAGVLLTLFGLGLFVLELKVPSYGLLTTGGLISLVFGALMLVDSKALGLQVSWGLILPITLAMATIMAFMVRLAVSSQRQRPITGEAGMIDALGKALTPIAPGQIGRVATHGEIWTAITTEPLAEGDTVRILAVDHLTLTVRKA